MVNQRDSVHLQIQGKEKLRILVEDSLYTPAKMKYYVLLLNSNTPAEVKKGFSELEKIAQTDTLNTIALFECGLTLSKSNKAFNVPMIRQSFIGMEPNLVQANELFYRAINLDSLDYKSVYWAFNNLMEMKLDGSLSSKGDKQIIELYKLFNQRIENHADATSDLYRNAIISDGETLKAWGLIK